MRIVIPSVGYADYLAITLPAWQQRFPLANLTVVTKADDRDTLQITRRSLASAWMSDAWQRDGAVFNKAAALDDAFGFDDQRRAPPTAGDWCLAIDADVYPGGVWRSLAPLAADTLYGCARYACETADALEVACHAPRESLTLLAPTRAMAIWPNEPAYVWQAARKCLGYFQLFRYRPGLRFGSFPTAGHYDKAFRQQFMRRVGLMDGYVLHLGPRDPANYTGRTLPAWSRGVRHG